MPLPSSLTPLRNADFASYFGAQLFSSIGTWAQSTALGFIVLSMTNSPAALAIVVAITAIPSILLGPFTGAIADRMNRRKLLMACQCLGVTTALIAGLLLYQNALQPFHAYGLAVLVGIVASMEIPLSFALSADMNTGGEIRKAASLMSIALTAGRTIGSVLAGLLLSRINGASVFWFNAASYLPIIAVLLIVRPAQIKNPVAGQNLLQDFADGLRYARANPRILDLMLIIGIFLMVGFISPTLFPPYNQNFLGGDALSLGSLFSAIGAGNLFGALVAVPFLNRQARSGLIVWALLIPGNLIVLFMGQYVRDLPLALLLSFCFGIFGASIYIIALGLVSQLTEPGMRGRVLTLFNIIASGAALPGALLAGTTGELLGAANALSLHASILLIFAAGFFVFQREFIRWRMAAA